MEVRLALESDAEDIARMFRAGLAESRKDLKFSPERCQNMMRGYLDRANPTIFVCEDQSGVIGMLVCNFYEHHAAYGIFASQEVLYIRPDKRGTRAAALLMKELIAWAEQIGANEVVGGNDNGFRSEQTARFLGRFGFRRVGYAMRRSV